MNLFAVKQLMILRAKSLQRAARLAAEAPSAETSGGRSEMERGNGKDESGEESAASRGEKRKWKKPLNCQGSVSRSAL